MFPFKGEYICFFPSRFSLYSVTNHYIHVSLNEVPLFIRKGRCIPVCQVAESVDELDTTEFTMLGYENSEYVLYEDDGIHKDYENTKNYRKIKK